MGGRVCLISTRRAGSIRIKFNDGPFGFLVEATPEEPASALSRQCKEMKASSPAGDEVERMDDSIFSRKRYRVRFFYFFQ